MICAQVLFIHHVIILNLRNQYEVKNLNKKLLRLIDLEIEEHINEILTPEQERERNELVKEIEAKLNA